MVEFPTSWQTPYCKSPALRGVRPFDDHLSLSVPHCWLEYFDPSNIAPHHHISPPGGLGRVGAPHPPTPQCKESWRPWRPLDHAFEWDNRVPPQQTVLRRIMESAILPQPIPQFLTTYHVTVVVRSQSWGSWGLPIFLPRSCHGRLSLIVAMQTPTEE